ncbi:MAG TPA: ABC transporter substrate-binding protein [Bauldia sp.]|nr:ABC transporter substrate-binding protein [Bauldia sp.]
MFRLALALSAALFATGAAAEQRTIVDAAGRSVPIADTSRIVAIGGAVTEILYALRLEDRIVAVDLTSDFPERAQQKASVGYMRTLSPEGVLSVAPSLVLAIEGSGPKEAIDVLEKASVPFVLVPEAHDAAGVVAKIRFVADVVGEHEKGKALANAVAADLATVAASRPPQDQRRKAIFVLSMAGGGPMVAGEGTSAADVFALAGVQNALTGVTGYKAANEEASMQAMPDAVVMMSRGEHVANADEVFASAAFAGTPAAHDKRLVVLPGEYLLGLGPRTAQAARDLFVGIYPDRPPPAVPERPWSTDTE